MPRFNAGIQRFGDHYYCYACNLELSTEKSAKSHYNKDTHTENDRIFIDLVRIHSGKNFVQHKEVMEYINFLAPLTVHNPDDRFSEEEMKFFNELGESSKRKKSKRKSRSRKQ